MNKFGCACLMVAVALMCMCGCQQAGPNVTPVPTPEREPTPQAGVLVSLEAQRLSLAVGETTEISVQIERAEDLMGAEVHLQFDPDQVVVEDADTGMDGVQVAHGDWLMADFVAANLCDLEAGQVDYAIAQMPPHPPVGGSGQLLTMTVKALSQGSARITLFSVILADATGKELAAHLIDSTVELTVQ